MDTLLARYDRLLLMDTETTGLSFRRDEIIEFSAVAVELVDGNPTVVLEYDELVTLSPGGSIPEKIQKLTGITEEDVRQRGIPKEKVCRDIQEMLTPNTLLVAYNAHFDLSFLYYLLLGHGDPTVLKGKDKLDLLTVYRDRRPFPHKLCNAIESYGLSGQVANSHRAIDDVLATVAVMERMSGEKDDLIRYVNLFGYLPQFGMDSKPIGSVTYKPQPYGPKPPLYEV